MRRSTVGAAAPVQHRPDFLAAEVQRYAALAGIVGGEVAADAAELRMPATRTLAAGRFDLDDLGAEIGEIQAAERTGGEGPDLHYAYAVQRHTRRFGGGAVLGRQVPQEARRTRRRGDDRRRHAGG